ncbi:MAG: hypothetical protein HRT58_04610 [Crocinitomicaceae bacterium]|nr:polysaccharide lyase [Flavobacteriales bacterium]NQZ34919.1 hypothetical protein [Crocinitomicaceae bacterium]
MKKQLLFLGLTVVLFGCNKEKYFAGPNAFSDDFESYASFDDLLTEDGVNWSSTQQTYDANTISLSTDQAHSGTTSLKFDAVISTEDQLSKCSIFKQKMAFYEGETVRSTIWYYIDGDQELDWLFLMDLEEQTAIGAGPGMRVANVGIGNYGTVEFKFKSGNLEQQTHSFPRNQWFKITLETHLSQKKKGSVRLYLDDLLILEEKNTRTLPKDVLYNLQGTKGMYSSIEIGITANSFSNGAVIYADDFSIEVIN